MRRHPFYVLHEIIHRLFKGRIVYPSAVRGNHTSMAEALSDEGWPYIDEIRGHFIFNLNLFPSNERCRAVYYGLQDGAMPGEQRVFFDRAKGDDEIVARGSLFSAFVEGERNVIFRLNSGMMARLRMPRMVDDNDLLAARYERSPSNIFDYDFAP